MSDDLPTRADLRMVERAIVQRWEIPTAAFEKLPGVLVGLIADAAKSDRDRLRAASVLVTMDRANLDRETQADKVARLDEGHATERVEFAPIVIGRVERVGQPIPPTDSDRDRLRAASVLFGRVERVGQPIPPTLAPPPTDGDTPPHAS